MVGAVVWNTACGVPVVYAHAPAPKRLWYRTRKR